MSDFKSRLIDEKDQLQDKTEKLDAFLKSDKSNEIDNVQRDLLLIQLSSMITYLNVLTIRIERL
jgi:hypothetical protein